MSTAASESDSDTPDDWHWDVLSWHFGMMVVDGTVRIGGGATMPARYAQTQARRMFLGALYRIAPHVSAELLQCEPLDVRNASGEPAALWTAYTGADWNNPESAMAREAAKRVVVTFKPAAIREHIRAWQERHHLEDSWIAVAAHETIMAANLSFGYPDHPEVVTWLLPAGLPLMLSADDIKATVHDGKVWDPFMSFDRGRAPKGSVERPLETRPDGLFTYIPEHRQIDVPVYLDHLKHPDMVLDDGVLEDDGWLGEFDPRTQDVDDAVRRLMPALETRLRRALESIAADDRTLNGARHPITFRSAAAFEWLVRFQVLGERRAAIATAAGKGRPHVTREINRVAKLIGLTLRPEPGGRPRRKHAITRKHVR